jgi:hypothetical protein
MDEFEASDFAPLDDFPLVWRWTRRSHDLLPTAVLATIRPLSPAAARALAAEAAARCRGRRASELDLSILAEWDDADSVRGRLQELEIEDNEQIILSWSQSVALLTRWGTFARYWDAFCYPSSDDVTVWSRTGDWTLCYRHFQVIEFGRHGPAT